MRRTAHTPSLRQAEAAECGLASLAILMGHHGRHLTLPQLRARTGDPRLGTTMSILRRLAREEGFIARARRVEPSAFGALPLPALVHLRFIHFAVVEAVGPRGVRLNDPAMGVMWLPHEEFDRDFTGLALWLEGDPPRCGTAPAPHHALRPMLRQPAPASLMAAGAGGMVALAAATAPAVALMAGLGGGALALWTLGAALRRGAARRLLRGLGETARAAPDALRWTGQPLARLLAPLALTGGWASPAVALPAAGALAAGAVALDPAWGTALAACLLADTALALRPSLLRGGAAGLADPGPLPAAPPPLDMLTEPGGWKVGGLDDDLFADLAGRHALLAGPQLEAEQARGGVTALGTAALALPALGFVAGMLPAATAAGLGALAAASLVPPAFLRRHFGVARLRPALHRLTEPPPPALPPPLPVPGGPLALRAEALCWPQPGRGRPVLAGLSFDLAPGGALAVAGPPSAGKTALLRLATGLAEPGGGQLGLGGAPPCRLPPGVAILVGAVPWLPPVTVAEALRLGKASDEAALRAVLEEVELWPNLAPRGGLGFVIRRGGAELSGGQRRRLGLARALLRAPGLLALDGTLDALEPPLAARLVGRLRARGMTLLVATRREDVAALLPARLDLAPA